MKRKKLLGMVAALTLVAVVGIGATLAYFSDSTGKLTNKFTFTDKGIELTLDEAKVDEKNKATTDRIPEGQSQEYKNIEPNAMMDKDPTVTVKANSVDTNVFVAVNNANEAAKLKITDMSAQWTEVNPTAYGLKAEANTTYYVYAGTKATGTVEAGDAFKVVPTNEADVALEAVFNHVQAGTDIKDGVTFTDIVVKAAAVQANNTTDTDAAASALALLGCTK